MQLSTAVTRNEHVTPAVTSAGDVTRDVKADPSVTAPCWRVTKQNEYLEGQPVKAGSWCQRWCVVSQKLWDNITSGRLPQFRACTNAALRRGGAR